MFTIIRIGDNFLEKGINFQNDNIARINLPKISTDREEGCIALAPKIHKFMNGKKVKTVP